MNRWATLLMGRPIPDRAEQAEQVGPARGVAMLGLDALASAAYGPEALLTILIVIGAASARHVLPLSLLICAVLLLVSLSYRQTIAAYPNGGGAYTVARDNLGRGPGLIAAASLALDYILNVAVAIAAGVGALVSALPALLPWTLPLCLFMLALLTLVNVRGVRSTSSLLLLPTYFFVGCLLVTIAIGVGRAVTSGWHPSPVAPPASVAGATTPVSAWLLVRAFANGSTAMTGIEAVSNGVPIFRAPSVVGARRTLAAITAILIALLLGVAVLCRIYEITATPPGEAGYQSVLSQLAGAVSGRGFFYHLTMIAVVSVLALSANTSFADFPRICRLLALDGHLPESFAHRGRRLVFSHGIVVLALTSGLLLVIFEGITDRLIPLFAVGAFTSFTLSQVGMVQHWRRRPSERAARTSMVMNAAGALATGITLAVVTVAKFREGAWLSVVVILGLRTLFDRVRRHYDVLEREIAPACPIDLRPLPSPHVVVPIRRWDRAAQRALQLATTLSSDVSVVQVLTSERQHDDLSDRWRDLTEASAARAGVPAPRLVVLTSEYRELFAPILGFVRKIQEDDPTRHVAVVVPQIIPMHWYSTWIDNPNATLLKTLLLFLGGPRVAVISTPWHVDEAIPSGRR